MMSAIFSLSWNISQSGMCCIHMSVTSVVVALYRQSWGRGDNVWTRGATSVSSPVLLLLLLVKGLTATVALLQQEIVACDKVWKRGRREKAALEQRVRQATAPSICLSVRLSVHSCCISACGIFPLLTRSHVSPHDAKSHDLFSNSLQSP